MTSTIERRITVGIYETQPLIVAGLRTALETDGTYALLEPARSLDDAVRLVIGSCPRVMILDKAFGSPAITDFLTRLRDRVPTSFVVWSHSMTEPEALRLLKLGARGIIRKTAETGSLLACLEAVAAGFPGCRPLFTSPELLNG